MNWINSFKNQPNKSLKLLYEQSRGSCISWLNKQYNINDQDALEIFQISVVILYDNITQNKLTTVSGSIQTYLYAIAKNKARELQRKNQKEIRTGDFISIFSNYISEEDVSTEGTENAVKKSYEALKALGDPCQTLLQLFYHQQMDLKDITQKLGYKNKDTTKNLKYKCLKRLQSIYNEHQ